MMVIFGEPGIFEMIFVKSLRITERECRFLAVVGVKLYESVSGACFSAPRHRSFTPCLLALLLPSPLRPMGWEGYREPPTPKGVDTLMLIVAAK